MSESNQFMKLCTIRPTYEQAIAELDRLRAENERLKAEVESEKMMRELDKTVLQSHKQALERVRGALDSAWACIWDGQLSGKGVTQEYAQSVSDEIKQSLAAINAALGKEGK